MPLADRLVLLDAALASVLAEHGPQGAAVEEVQVRVRSGPPSDRFLWPLDLMTTAGSNDYGYIMPLRESRFKGIVDLMKRRAMLVLRQLYRLRGDGVGRRGQGRPKQRSSARTAREGEPGNQGETSHG